MKKRLNTDNITNELEGASAFFRPSTPPKAAPQAEVSTPPPAPGAASQPAQPVKKEVTEPRNEPTNVSTNQRTFIRKKIRHTFDIYDDQLLSLREIAIERQKIFGERVLLGDLVQEALDMLISKERNKE